MTVTFFINYLNHHQVFVADEMYRLLGDDFRFVATYPRNPVELKGGLDYSSRPYCLFSAEKDEDMAEARRLVLKSDVCVFGAGNLDWEKLRCKTDKLSFEISERWFKRGWINILSPRLIRWWWLYQTRLCFKPFYKLCASAYTAPDCRKLGTFKNRCFKWGYFTKVTDKKLDDSSESRQLNSTLRILWVARFLNWKHPEKMIQLCDYLLGCGYDNFVIDMIGSGPEYDDIRDCIEEKGFSKHIKLLGAMPNDNVLEQMRDHDIFCFTSDRNEGWGAVLNEAMSCGCCVVANDEIGSVPYLINNGKNGMTYHKGDVNGLCEAVKFLIDNPAKRKEMGKKAQFGLRHLWSPVKAAMNFIQLSTELLNGRTPEIVVGPCSKA